MDIVNKPPHYQGEVECIECIRASMSKIEFMGYLKGNLMKYPWRYRGKNGLEDLKKAQVYLKWLIKEVEDEESMDVVGSSSSGKGFDGK